MKKKYKRCSNEEDLLTNGRRALTLYFQVGLAHGIGSTKGHFTSLGYLTVVQDECVLSSVFHDLYILQGAPKSHISYGWKSESGDGNLVGVQSTFSSLSGPLVECGLNHQEP